MVARPLDVMRYSDKYDTAPSLPIGVKTLPITVDAALRRGVDPWTPSPSTCRQTPV